MGISANTVIHFSDLRLRRTSEKVVTIDDSVLALANRMVAVMKASDGLGLAAIQIGVPLRVVVTALEPPFGSAPFVLVNPEIIRRSHATFDSREGCLSIPGGREVVERAKEIEVTYLDLLGVVQMAVFTGLAAACLQHEIDHLNGVLFIDRLSAKKRRELLQSIELRRNVAEFAKATQTLPIAPTTT